MSIRALHYSQPTEQIVARVERWVESFVIGLNLCPFASSVLRRGQLNVIVADSDDEEECLQQLADEADALATGDPQATTLLVLADGFGDFDDYLDFLAVGEALLEDIDLDGQIQLASFHPHYQFDDSDYDDAENWTNRAPYPMVHLLTEESVGDAVDSHPDPESIPDANMDKLESMGTEVLESLNRAIDS